MKIAIVCPYDLGRPGGVQAHILSLADALRARGHEVWTVAPGSVGAPSHPTDGIARFGQSRAVSFNKTVIDISIAWGAEGRRLKVWLAEQNFDVIHFHTIWDPFLPLQVLAAAGPAARVATFHDTPPETFSGRLTRQFFKTICPFIARRVQRMTAVSPGLLGHLTPPSGTTVEILPPAIKLQTPSPDINPPVENGDVEILFLSRLEPRKGAEVLLRAFSVLEKSGVAARLKIVGSGDEEATLRQIIHNNKLQRVSLEGHVSEETKQAYLARADIFCAPALYGESYGLVLAEAMAAGLPIIAAANSGFRHVMREQAANCLVEPGDVDALASALRRLISSPVLRQELSTWGRNNWKQHDIETWVCEFEALYQSAIDARHHDH